MSRDTDVDTVRRSCLILDSKPRKLSVVYSMVQVLPPINSPTKTRTKTVFETVEKPPVWTPENEKLKPSN